MASAKKLPSGNWRVLKYTGTENGKRKYASYTASPRKRRNIWLPSRRLNLKNRAMKKQKTASPSVRR